MSTQIHLRPSAAGGWSAPWNQRNLKGSQSIVTSVLGWRVYFESSAKKFRLRHAELGDARRMRGSRFAQAMKTVLCAAVAGLTLASAPSASQQTSWTLDTILKQLDTEAGQFH